MSCPDSKLVVVDLDRGEKAGVSGCGQRAVYVYSGSNDGWSRSGEQPTEVNVKVNRW